MSTIALNSLLGYSFADSALLREALSAAGVLAAVPQGNKRLAQLGMTVGHLVLLNRWYPTRGSRGETSHEMSEVLSRDMLATVGRSVELDLHVQVNVAQGAAAVSPIVLSDTVLALIAAVWLDSAQSLHITTHVMTQMGVLENRAETMAP